MAVVDRIPCIYIAHITILSAIGFHSICIFLCFLLSLNTSPSSPLPLLTLNYLPSVNCHLCDFFTWTPSFLVFSQWNPLIHSQLVNIKWQSCLCACMRFFKNKSNHKNISITNWNCPKNSLVKLNKTFPFRIQSFMYYYSGYMATYLYVCALLVCVCVCVVQIEHWNGIKLWNFRSVYFRKTQTNTSTHRKTTKIYCSCP